MTPTKAKKRRRPRAAVNKVTANYRIADALWAVLQPVLPVHVNSHRFGGGRPRVADRRCADAIFYVLRTGCQWGALDATDLCRRSTATANALQTVYKEGVRRPGVAEGAVGRKE